MATRSDPRQHKKEQVGFIDFIKDQAARDYLATLEFLENMKTSCFSILSTSFAEIILAAKSKNKPG